MLGHNVENEMTVMDNEDPADPSAHEPRVTGAPETIWLVYGELEHDDTHANCADSGEVTWCEDAQFPADVRYLRADLMYQQAREIAAQEVAAERERWQRIATNAQAVTNGGEDRLDYFKVPSHLMAALALALDEWPNRG